MQRLNTNNIQVTKSMRMKKSSPASILHTYWGNNTEVISVKRVETTTQKSKKRIQKRRKKSRKDRVSPNFAFFLGFAKES